jgi:hypothetical protein
MKFSPRPLDRLGHDLVQRLFSAVRAPWYCISSATIWPAGASARPASIDGGDQRTHRQLALRDQVDADR